MPVRIERNLQEEVGLILKPFDSLTVSPLLSYYMIIIVWSLMN